MKKWSLKTWHMMTAVAILVILAFIMIVIAARVNSEAEEEPVEEYTYTLKEQILADEVIVYLQNAAGLGDVVSTKTANEAVESYRLILQSDVDVVSDDHTQAIQERITRILTEYVGKDTALSEEDIPALSAGVAEIVWRSILSQIESSTENVEESDFFYLAESMKQQIRELEERKMKVSIRADIKNNTDLTSEELLSMLEGMSDEEIEALAKALGVSVDELYQMLENEGAERDAGDKDLEEQLAKLQKELEEKLRKELSDAKSDLSSANNSAGAASNGANGRGGTNGTDGKDGQDGKDGKDGKAGQNGDSVFIRYSETSTGANMTEKPTDSTKYMGTYVGANASTNAADYIWTRYSDATITYSDGTLYITQ